MKKRFGLCQAILMTLMTFSTAQGMMDTIEEGGDDWPWNSMQVCQQALQTLESHGVDNPADTMNSFLQLRPRLDKLIEMVTATGMENPIGSLSDILRWMHRYIDYTLLTPEDDTKLSCVSANTDVLDLRIQEAIALQVKTLCLHSWDVIYAAQQLARAGSRVLPIAVVGFPSSPGNIDALVKETRAATQSIDSTTGEVVYDRAQEVDMVLNRKRFRDGTEEGQAQAYNEISAVVQAAGGIPVKVIFDSGDFTDDEIADAARLAESAGATFVKTSTGFNVMTAEGPKTIPGATTNAVRIMREATEQVLIKASGGIGTLKRPLK